MDHKTYVMRYIEDIDSTLAFRYGTPDHNNKVDPLDEMMFILLSRRTKSAGYESVYDELKEKYPNWAELAREKPEKLQEIIGRAGLGKIRADEILDNLKAIHDRFGEYSLNRLKKWGNPNVLEYLTSLRGIAEKSAYCIMMYSLSRRVFPADTHVIRICNRLGLTEYDGRNHKKAQTELADMFPEKIRYSLHVNMVSHGKKVCTPNPKCLDCIIRGFCHYNRTKENGKGKPRLLDLFSGAGGMSVGFEQAGFEIYSAIESDPHAASSFLYNHPEMPGSRVINKKIEDVEPEVYLNSGIKVIVAGPPCQEFSKVRKNSNKEWGRKELYKEVLRFVAVIKPCYVVIENVPGMASHINKEYAEKVQEGLIELGYYVKSDMINAKEHGVPQNRIRLFFIARKIMRNSLEAAERSVERIWKYIESDRIEIPVSFDQGISGLPSLKPGEGSDILKNGVRGRRSDYALKMNCNGGPIYNHLARKHNPRDLEAYSIMEEGDNAIDLYNQRPDLMIYSTTNFPTKYFKIRSNMPSPTIVAHLRKDANSFIHPKDNRGITPREAARLQSFPDNYRFMGSFGIQFEQIGNAVPPLLAEVIARSIKAEIDRNRPRTKKGDTQV